MMSRTSVRARCAAPSSQGSRRPRPPRDVAGGQDGSFRRGGCPALTSDAGWVPRRHSARAGGLAAALGDAGFGTPARRGSLPSPALGVSMLPATGRRVPQLGDGCLSGSRDRAIDAPAWGGPGRPLAMGRARTRVAALAALAQSWSEGRVREEKNPACFRAGLEV
jgi:hypothetical protein